MFDLVTSMLYGIFSTSVLLILLRVAGKIIGQNPIATKTGYVKKTVKFFVIVLCAGTIVFYALVALYFAMVIAALIPYGFLAFLVGCYLATRLSKLSFIPW